MSASDWESLIARHLDGDASPDEAARLSTQLESDQEVRLLYLKMARVHALLVTGNLGEFRSVSTSTAPTKTLRVNFRKWLLPAAAAAFIAITGALTLLRGNSSEIRITAMEGDVEWTTADGRERYALEIGQSLLDGQIATLSPASWAAFEFPDGSKATLCGLSTLGVSKSEQKELHLTRGHLSTDVRPQPNERPLLVHTPAATLEVLGTQFDVVCDASETSLTVKEGKVQITRTNASASTTVSAGQQTMALLESAGSLIASNIKASTHEWRADLSKDAEHGQWISTRESVLEWVKTAVANGMDREAAGRIVEERLRGLRDSDGSLYGAELKPGAGAVVSLAVKRGLSAPVVLLEENRFRFHGNLHGSGSITLGFSVVDTTRGIGGRYTVERNVGPDEFQVDVPLDEFLGNDGATATGLELINCFVMGNDPTSRLEINAIELLQP